MITLNGQYDTAKVYASDIEQEAINQIQAIIDTPVSAGAHTRIMPDVHAGAGICIGYTAKLTDKIVPNFIGVDISCGMRVARLADVAVDDVDFERLDKVIRRNVPSGFSIRNKVHALASQIDLSELRCHDALRNVDKLYNAVGTLGGGNHFIELNVDELGRVYLVVHTGSRNLGKQVADYYQNLAYDYHVLRVIKAKEAIINELQNAGRETEIDDALRYFSQNNPPVDKATAYIEGELMDDYLHDMALCQRYSALNRQAIVDSIAVGMRWRIEEEFETLHNYVDLEHGIIRKGAVSARLDEVLLIPMNMAWGSVICRGLGNPEWNYSCSHGGGRKMSRKAARQQVNMDDYRAAMEGVYSTCVTEATVDESPMAYKDPEVVIADMANTVEVLHRLRPIFNYKAN